MTSADPSAQEPAALGSGTPLPRLTLLKERVPSAQAGAMYLHALRALRCEGPGGEASCTVQGGRNPCTLEVTFIDYEASWVTWLGPWISKRPLPREAIGLEFCKKTMKTILRLLAIVVWFSLGWMAFWVLPLLWPAFKAGLLVLQLNLRSIWPNRTWSTTAQISDLAIDGQSAAESEYCGVCLLPGPRCLNVIARKSRISFPTFRTEVICCTRSVLCEY